MVSVKQIETKKIYYVRCALDPAGFPLTLCAILIYLLTYLKVLES